VSLIERGVSKLADQVQDALDKGQAVDTAVVVSLAQECVHLTRELKYLATGEDPDG
jgi:hypothetical protein